MKAPLFVAACGAVVAFMSMPSPSLAQEKTVKQCEDEWRANKAENQAKGIKEKDYVAGCRGGTAATTAAPAAAPAEPGAAPATGKGKTAKECRAEWQANKAENQAKGVTEKAYVEQCRGGAATTTAPAAAPAEPGAAPAAGKGKTAKECRAEWQANKADNQAKGITEKAYVEQCRAGATPAAASPPAAPAPAETQAPAETAAPTAAPARAPTPAPPRRAAPATPAGEGQYGTEAEARAHCPADTVVWVNLKSDIYHFAGARSYGKTKEGAYMSEKEALAHGDRASKNEKHP